MAVPRHVMTIRILAVRWTAMAVPITTWLAAVRWLARRVPARRATLARTVRAAVRRWHF
ncbi:hypothetical protein O977_11775 [Mycobacterium avium subsp. paratuberculosis 10-5975]|nr:hypothetical protein O977_11775 [Mycobacterium avium subsp. paratuberculosis 10-5975]